MKRSVIITAAALMLALAISLTACTVSPGARTTPEPKNDEKITLDPAATPEHEDPAGVIAGPGYGYEFIRVGWSDTIGSRPVQVISDTETLNKLLLPEFEGEVRSELAAKYNDEFFKNNHIVMFVVTYGSGSIRPVVENVETVDGAVVITVDGKMDGEIGTCDMAAHIAIVSLDNSRFPAESTVKVDGSGFGKTGDAA